MMTGDSPFYTGYPCAIRSSCFTIKSIPVEVESKEIGKAP